MVYVQTQRKQKGSLQDAILGIEGRKQVDLLSSGQECRLVGLVRATDGDCRRS